MNLPSGMVVSNVVRAATAVALPTLLAVACTGGERSSVAQATTSSVRYPFLELLETSIGRDAPELLFAAVDAQAAFVRDCMAEGGFPRSELQFTDSDSLQKEVVYYPNTTSQIIDQLDVATDESEADSADSVSESERAAESQRFEECGETARARFVNPAEPFYVWMVTSMDDVVDRAAAVPEYQAADDAFGECLNEVGLGEFDDEAAVANHYQSRQVAVLDRYHSGELTKELTIAELSPIALEEDLIAEPLNDCIARREDARQRVLAPLEDEWIEANSAAVKEQIEELMPRIAEFESVLSEAER